MIFSGLCLCFTPGIIDEFISIITILGLYFFNFSQISKSLLSMSIDNISKSIGNLFWSKMLSKELFPVGQTNLLTLVLASD